MTETNPARPDDTIRWVGVLALGATIVSRGLATALPGAAAGIERWIETTQLGGAILSQSMVVFGAATSVGLLVTTLWRRELPYAYRLVALPTSAVVLTLVAMSARLPLHPIEARLLGATVTLLATTAAIVGLRAVNSRAAALVLLGTAAAGGLHLVAHRMSGAGAAVRPFASTIASAGMLADVLALTFATAWLLARGGRRWRPVLAALVVVSLVIAWGAFRGSADGASFWQVLASKALADMAPSPAPPVSAAVTLWLDTYALGAATVLLTLPRSSGTLPAAMSLALVARGSPDIPLCALMVALAALLTALGATVRRPVVERRTDDEPAAQELGAPRVESA